MTRFLCSPVRALRLCLLSTMLLSVSTAGFAQMGGPSPVDVAEVELGDVYQEVRLTGSIAPRRSVELSTHVSGAIREMLVDEGDFVEKGQVLARLVETPTRLMLQETMAELALVEASLAELNNGSRIEDIEAKRGELADARARLELARVEADRLNRLLETAAVSKSDVDRAEAERDRATAETQRYEAELSRLENGARTEELARAEADVATASARVSQLEYALERHEIRAPFNGIIGRKMSEVGAWVGVGDPIFAMAELDVVRITAQLPERYFPLVHVGTPVTLTVDALGEAEPIEAHVSIKVPMADQMSRTFPIRVDVPNDGFRLAPGMMTRLRLAVGRDSGERARLLPKDALVMAPDGSRTAWVVRDAPEGEGLVVFPQTVQIGREFDDKVELTGGELQEGDRVVVRGNELLRPAQPVSILGEGGGAPAGGGGWGG